MSSYCTDMYKEYVQSTYMYSVHMWIYVCITYICMYMLFIILTRYKNMLMYNTCTEYTEKINGRLDFATGRRRRSTLEEAWLHLVCLPRLEYVYVNLHTFNEMSLIFPCILHTTLDYDVIRISLLCIERSRVQRIHMYILELHIKPIKHNTTFFLCFFYDFRDVIK